MTPMRYVKIFYFSSVTIIHAAGFFYHPFGEWMSDPRLSVALFLYSLPTYALLIVFAGTVVLCLAVIIGIGIESVVTGKNVYKEYI